LGGINNGPSDDLIARKSDRSDQSEVRVRIKEIWHPAIKSGPDDDLADFPIAARMTGFL
jgi:hypothetical protein